MIGSIQRRGADRWLLRVEAGRTADGRRRQVARTIVGTKRQAQSALREFIAFVQNGGYTGKETVAGFMHRWLDYVSDRTAATTHHRYARIVATHIEPAIGHVPLVKLNPAQIAELYARWQRTGRIDGKGGLSPKTIRQNHAVLRAAIQQAMRWGLIPRNPVAAVQPPRIPRREIHALSDQQVAALIHACRSLNPRYYLPTLAAVGTAARRGELLAVEWSALDFDRGTMQVRRALELVGGKLHFKEPKSGRSRAVTLPASLVAALRAHKVAQAKERLALGPVWQDNDLVFPGPDGRPWYPATFTSGFIRTCRRAGLGRVRFHDLRHTAATMLLAQGVHPKVVAERLGHSTVALTLDLYSHVTPSLQDAAAATLDPVLARVAGEA